eukprot:1003857-Amphidinium_carterae.1
MQCNCLPRSKLWRTTLAVNCGGVLKIDRGVGVVGLVLSQVPITTSSPPNAPAYTENSYTQKQKHLPGYRSTPEALRFSQSVLSGKQWYLGCIKTHDGNASFAVTICSGCSNRCVSSPGCPE